MSRLERCLLYGMSALVVAGLVTSRFGRREGAIRPVVHAADCHDNHKLDVLRRGISFAQNTCVKERDRAAGLERISVLFQSLSLGALQNAISYALDKFRTERDRSVKLQQSSVPGDRQLAKDALLRSQDWYNMEKTLRALYLAEVKRMTKEVEQNRTRAKEARRRSQDWYRTEGMLKAIFAAEVERMKGGTGLGTSNRP